MRYTVSICHNSRLQQVIVERSEMSSKKFQEVTNARQRSKAREPGPGSYDPKLDIVREKATRGISALNATESQRPTNIYGDEFNELSILNLNFVDEVHHLV